MVNWLTGDCLVWIVFSATYVGMASGRVPGLALDRTGMALCALLILIVSGHLAVTDLGRVLELPALILLFALMLIAAHFELARGFEWIATQISQLQTSPKRLLALVIAAGGLMSMVLVNDIVAFAFTPMLCRGLQRRGLDPRPFLLALAATVNAGSAATLIGNPQNILISQAGNLNFLIYATIAIVPALATMAVIYGVILLVWRDALNVSTQLPNIHEPIDFNGWQIAKSLLAVAALTGLLISVDNRVVAVLGVSLILLLGRRFSTRGLLGRVDGSLLVMIACLFAITTVAIELPQAQHAVEWMRTRDLLPYSLQSLALFSVVASNTIGNVPAVVLLLKAATDIPTEMLYGLALFSTLSGNLLLTGSLANIIVVERSRQTGVTVGFLEFARVGIPVTFVSMTLAVFWLWWLATFA